MSRDRVYYTPTQISGKQRLTPEGFLLCEEVGVARTGEQLYGRGEVPVAPGPDGIVHVERDAREVFRPEFIASFEGKPVVNDHPPVDVNPDNWEKYAIGVVLNPRRGKGAQDDILFADLLITKRDAIALVRAGKREISSGYDADYYQIGVGRARQVDMIANHVALVESGRCGPRCAIGDRDTVHATATTSTQESPMKSTLKDKILAAIRGRDESKLDEIVAEIDSNGAAPAVHVHVHDNANPGENEKGEKEGTEGKPGEKPNAKDRARDDDSRHRFTDAEIEGRFGRVERKVDDMAKDLKKVLDRKMKDEDEEEEKKEKEKEEREKAKDKDIEEEIPAGAEKTRDSVCLEDTYRQTLALAEIIAPGVEAPSFDKKADRQKTYDSICALRRTSLEQAYTQGDVRTLMDDMLRGRKVRDLACPEVRPVFAAVAAYKRRQNNGGSEARTTDFSRPAAKSGVKSLADLNKQNSEFYGKQ